jgi:hypothetical protein
LNARSTKGHSNVIQIEAHHVLGIFDSIFDSRDRLFKIHDEAFPDPEGRSLSHPDDLSLAALVATFCDDHGYFTCAKIKPN